MKKIFLLFLLMVFSATSSSGDIYRIKLRAAHHPEFIRIVMEGPEPVISSAIVNQRGHNIQVTFPGVEFEIEDEKVIVAYKKTSDDTILFIPLEFRGFKVFTLKHPNRLVIDIFLVKGRGPERKGEKQDRSKKKQERSEKKEIKKMKLPGIMTVVIDSGHGGYEYGITRENYIEKNVVLDIAKKLASSMNRDNTRCFLTRKSDRFLGLKERARFANSKGAEVFISLHVGNNDNIVIYAPFIAESVPDIIKPFIVDRGQEEFMAESFLLLESMRNAVASDYGNDMVQVKPLPYSLLSNVEAAAIMIEFPSFDDAYYGGEFRTDMVSTIHKGIYLYEEKTSRWD